LIVVAVSRNEHGVWSLRVTASPSCKVTTHPEPWSHKVRHQGEVMRIGFQIRGYSCAGEYPTITFDAPRSFSVRFNRLDSGNGAADPDTDPYALTASGKP
jgi:hypothetical protein